MKWRNWTYGRGCFNTSSTHGILWGSPALRWTQEKNVRINYSIHAVIIFHVRVAFEFQIVLSFKILNIIKLFVIYGLQKLVRITVIPCQNFVHVRVHGMPANLAWKVSALGKLEKVRDEKSWRQLSRVDINCIETSLYLRFK